MRHLMSTLVLISISILFMAVDKDKIVNYVVLFLYVIIVLYFMIANCRGAFVDFK